MLAPDLSGDLVQVLQMSQENTLSEIPGQEPLFVPVGTGPRHGVFYQPGGASNKTYLYLILETANMIHGYNVTYNNNGTLSFDWFYMEYTFPGAPTGSSGAEIQLTVSNINHI